MRQKTLYFNCHNILPIRHITLDAAPGAFSNALIHTWSLQSRQSYYYFLIFLLNKKLFSSILSIFLCTLYEYAQVKIFDALICINLSGRSTRIRMDLVLLAGSDYADNRTYHCRQQDNRLSYHEDRHFLEDQNEHVTHGQFNKTHCCGHAVHSQSKLLLIV